MNTSQKDATRDDSAGDFLGIYNCGGDKSPALHHCTGNDEVIHSSRRGAIRQRENAVELAGAITVHSISSRVRSGCDSSCSSWRSSCWPVNDRGTCQIPVSIQVPYPECHS